MRRPAHYSRSKRRGTLTVDAMRKIDYFAGVPLCFFFSVLCKLLSLLAAKPSAKPEKALFIELSEMGSAILVDPAMRKLRRESGAALHFVIFAKNRERLNLS